MTIEDITPIFPSFKKNLKRIDKLKNEVDFLKLDDIKKTNNKGSLGLRVNDILFKAEQMEETEADLDNSASVSNGGIGTSNNMNVVAPQPVDTVINPKEQSDEEELHDVNNIMGSKPISSKTQEMLNSQFKNEKTINYQGGAKIKSKADPNSIFAGDKEDRILENFATNSANTSAQYKKSISKEITNPNAVEEAVTHYSGLIATNEFRNKIEELGLMGAIDWAFELFDPKKQTDEFSFFKNDPTFTEEFKKELAGRNFGKGYRKAILSIYETINPEVFSSFVETADPSNKSILERAMKDLSFGKNKQGNKELLVDSISSELIKEYNDKDKINGMIKHIRNFVDKNFDNMDLSKFKNPVSTEEQTKLLEEFENSKALRMILAVNGREKDKVSSLSIKDLSDTCLHSTINEFISELQTNPEFAQYKDNPKVTAARLFGDKFVDHYDAKAVLAFSRSNPYYIRDLIGHINDLINNYNDEQFSKKDPRRMDNIELLGAPGELIKHDIETIANFFGKKNSDGVFKDGRDYNDLLGFVQKNNINKNFPTVKSFTKLKDMNDGGAIEYISGGDRGAAIALRKILWEGRQGQTEFEEKNGSWLREGFAYFTNPNNRSQRLNIEDILTSPIFRDPEILNRFLKFANSNPARSTGSFAVMAAEILPLITGAYYKNRSVIKNGVPVNPLVLAMEDYEQNPFIIRMKLASKNEEGFNEFVKFIKNVSNDLGEYKGKSLFNMGMLNGKIEEFFRESVQREGRGPEIQVEAAPKRASSQFSEVILSGAPRQHMNKMEALSKSGGTTGDPEVDKNIVDYVLPMYKDYFVKFYKYAKLGFNGTNVTANIASLEKQLINELNFDIARTLFKKDKPYNYFSDKNKIKDESIRNAIEYAEYIFENFDPEFLERVKKTEAGDKGLLLDFPVSLPLEELEQDVEEVGGKPASLSPAVIPKQDQRVDDKSSGNGTRSNIDDLSRVDYDKGTEELLNKLKLGTLVGTDIELLKERVKLNPKLQTRIDSITSSNKKLDMNNMLKDYRKTGKIPDDKLSKFTEYLGDTWFKGEADKIKLEAKKAEEQASGSAGQQVLNLNDKDKAINRVKEIRDRIASKKTSPLTNKEKGIYLELSRILKKYPDLAEPVNPKAKGDSPLSQSEVAERKANEGIAVDIRDTFVAGKELSEEQKKFVIEHPEFKNVWEEAEKRDRDLLVVSDKEPTTEEMLVGIEESILAGMPLTDKQKIFKDNIKAERYKQRIQAAIDKRNQQIEGKENATTEELLNIAKTRLEELKGKKQTKKIKEEIKTLLEKYPVLKEVAAGDGSSNVDLGGGAGENDSGIVGDLSNGTDKLNPESVVEDTLSTKEESDFEELLNEMPGNKYTSEDKKGLIEMYKKLYIDKKKGLNYAKNINNLIREYNKIEGIKDKLEELPIVESNTPAENQASSGSLLEDADEGDNDFEDNSDGTKKTLEMVKARASNPFKRGTAKTREKEEILNKKAEGKTLSSIEEQKLLDTDEKREGFKAPPSIGKISKTQRDDLKEKFMGYEPTMDLIKGKVRHESSLIDYKDASVEDIKQALFNIMVNSSSIRDKDGTEELEKVFPGFKSHMREYLPEVASGQVIPFKYKNRAQDGTGFVAANRKDKQTYFNIYNLPKIRKNLIHENNKFGGKDKPVLSKDIITNSIVEAGLGKYISLTDDEQQKFDEYKTTVTKGLDAMSGIAEKIPKRLVRHEKDVMVDEIDPKTNKPVMINQTPVFIHKKVNGKLVYVRANKKTTNFKTGEIRDEEYDKPVMVQDFNDDGTPKMEGGVVKQIAELNEDGSKKKIFVDEYIDEGEDLKNAISFIRKNINEGKPVEEVYSEVAEIFKHAFSDMSEEQFEPLKEDLRDILMESGIEVSDLNNIGNFNSWLKHTFVDKMDRSIREYIPLLLKKIGDLTDINKPDEVRTVFDNVIATVGSEIEKYLEREDYIDDDKKYIRNVIEEVKEAANDFDLTKFKETTKKLGEELVEIDFSRLGFVKIIDKIQYMNGKGLVKPDLKTLENRFKEVKKQLDGIDKNLYEKLKFEDMLTALKDADWETYVAKRNPMRAYMRDHPDTKKKIKTQLEDINYFYTKDDVRLLGMSAARQKGIESAQRKTQAKKADSKTVMDAKIAEKGDSVNKVTKSIIDEVYQHFSPIKAPVEKYEEIIDTIDKYVVGALSDISEFRALKDEQAKKDKVESMKANFEQLFVNKLKKYLVNKIFAKDNEDLKKGDLLMEEFYNNFLGSVLSTVPEEEIEEDEQEDSLVDNQSLRGKDDSNTVNSSTQIEYTEEKFDGDIEGVGMKDNYPEHDLLTLKRRLFNNLNGKNKEGARDALGLVMAFIEKYKDEGKNDNSGNFEEDIEKVINSLK